MDMAKQAIEVLTSSERRLREIVGGAAANGDYETAARIMGWAKAVGALVTDAAPSEPPAHEPVNRDVRTPASRSRRAPTKGQYPKFFRRGDNLVKIGWSKKARSEYEHKAPRRVIDVLASAIEKRSNGRVFTTEELFPLKDEDGSEFPGYQSYVALAWLNAAGIVRQHGRHGYSTPNTSRLAGLIATRWQSLSQRGD